jgi:hypothetical protein
MQKSIAKKLLLSGLAISTGLAIGIYWFISKKKSNKKAYVGIQKLYYKKYSENDILGLIDTDIKNFHKILQQDGNYITEKICIQALTKGLDLKKIPVKYWTQNVCIQAIKLGSKLKRIPESLLTEELSLAAIDYSLSNFVYIKNPSEKLCYYAVHQKKDGIKHIKPEYLTYGMCELAVTIHSNIEDVPIQFIDSKLCDIYFKTYDKINYCRYPFEGKNLSLQLIDEIICIAEKYDKKIDIEIFNGNVLSGIQFNKLTKEREFVKLTNETETDNSIQFITGLNSCNKLFDHNNFFEKDGIYFSDKKNIKICIQENQETKYCRNVKIPYDAKVYIDCYAFRSDKLILSPRTIVYDYVKTLFYLSISQ